MITSFFWDDNVDRFYEQILQCIFIKMWSATLVVTISIVVIALPDGLAILAFRVPNLRSEDTPIGSAPDVTREESNSSRRFHIW